MSILQRKDRHDQWWVSFRANGRRIRRKAYVQTLEGAIELEQRLRAALDHGAECPHGLPLYTNSPFAEFAKRWMTDYVAIANRATSIKEKQYALNSRLLPAFGHLPVGSITTGTIDAQVTAWMKGGLSIKRINNLLTILRCSLRCAAEWSIIDRAPFVRHHRYIPPVPQYLTNVESTRLVEMMEPGFWRTFILFLLCTGARFGEAAALRWEDIQLDLDRPLVSIKRSVSDGVVTATKTNASRRTIALIPEIAIALRALQYRRPDSEWVFTSPTGKFYGPGGTSYILKRACKAACVPIVTWHKLRHSCATQLLMNGVPLTVVKEVLGHTSIEVTSIYTHVTPGLMWDYMQKLSPTGSSGDHRSFINKIAA